MEWVAGIVILAIIFGPIVWALTAGRKGGAPENDDVADEAHRHSIADVGHRSHERRGLVRTHLHRVDDGRDAASKLLHCRRIRFAVRAQDGERRTGRNFRGVVHAKQREGQLYRPQKSEDTAVRIDHRDRDVQRHSHSA